MYVMPMMKKEPENLKEGRKDYMGGLVGKKGKGEILN